MLNHLLFNPLEPTDFNSLEILFAGELMLREHQRTAQTIANYINTTNNDEQQRQSYRSNS